MSVRHVNHDSSGLPWRPTFEQNLSAMPLGASFALLIVDIRGFKLFNVTMSNDAGDKILEELAADLVRLFPDSLVGRYCGDSYVVQVRDKSGAEALAATLRTEFESKHADLSVRTIAKYSGCSLEVAKAYAAGAEVLPDGSLYLRHVLKLAVGIAYSSGPRSDLTCLFEAAETAVLASKMAAGGYGTSVAIGEY